MQVGAAATGSHGSGVRHKGFQGYTAALDFVLPNGDIKSYDRETCGEEEMASVAVSYKHTILQPRDDIDLSCTTGLATHIQQGSTMDSRTLHMHNIINVALMWH